MVMRFGSWRVRKKISGKKRLYIFAKEWSIAHFASLVNTASMTTTSQGSINL